MSYSQGGNAKVRGQEVQQQNDGRKEKKNVYVNHESMKRWTTNRIARRSSLSILVKFSLFFLRDFLPFLRHFPCFHSSCSSWRCTTLKLHHSFSFLWINVFSIHTRSGIPSNTVHCRFREEKEEQNLDQEQGKREYRRWKRQASHCDLRKRETWKQQKKNSWTAAEPFSLPLEANLSRKIIMA